MAKTVQIEGAERLLTLLKQAPQAAKPRLKEAVDNSLALLQDDVAQYPPQ